MTSTLNILFIGDIIGEPGLKYIEDNLKKIREAYNIHFAIANSENLSGGKGFLDKDVKRAFEAGINCLTGGNHTFSKLQSMELLKEEARLLRPANYHDDVYGRGYQLYPVTIDGGIFNVAVVNLMGRVYLSTLNCPFRTAKKIIDKISKTTNLIIVDFHGEATAEKQAFAWFIDGKASAVIGTHTHVQTADERVLPNGTAYITDVGMTGGFDGVIGGNKEASIARFWYQTPHKTDVATEDVKINAVVINIDLQTGKSLKIKRIFEPPWKSE
ncbi:MAG: TIGR00282 family metallophosphoesterase [Ignavibacteria bacterium]|nr:TIGR00282 family metallophosphoesterase [Ignavibacteria bacterium]